MFRMWPCFSSKKESLQPIDWSKANQYSASLDLTPTQIKNVKRAFSFLKKESKRQDLGLKVFRKMFKSNPEIMEFFNKSITESKALRRELGPSINIEYTLETLLFIGHLGMVIESIKLLVEELEDKPRFFMSCKILMVRHGKLEGIKREYFQKMFETIDKVMTRRRGYKRAKRADTKKFFLLVYSVITRLIPQNEMSREMSFGDGNFILHGKE